MVKIRLMRIGAKKNPHYRVVVVDARKKRSSDYIESLGYYDPRETTDAPLRIDTERAAYWLSQGAQPTDTTVRLLEKSGVEVPRVLAMRRETFSKRPSAQAEAAPAETGPAETAPAETAPAAPAPAEA